MSIDRCSDARAVVQAQFTRGDEGIIGDEAEDQGVYVVRATAGTLQRAIALRDQTTKALAELGMTVTDVELTSRSQGSENTLAFYIEVGGIRAL